MVPMSTVPMANCIEVMEQWLRFVISNPIIRGMNIDLGTIDAVLTSEAARILDVSPETIRTWERTGRLPAVRTRKGMRLFDRRDVERLAQERALASTGNAA